MSTNREYAGILLKLSNLLGLLMISSSARGAPLYFTMHPQSRVIATRTNFDLTCEAVGTPPITYRWMRNGKEVVLRGNIEVEGGRISFRPFQYDHRVFKYHVGRYQCIAINEDGAVFSEYADIESYGMTSFIRPSSQTVAPGDMARFYGGAGVAIPLPNITWQMNGKALKDGDRSSRVSIFPSGALHIENVMQQDAGQYVLTLTNGYRVRKFQPTLQIKEESTPCQPSIHLPSSHVRVNFGDTAVIEVIIQHLNCVSRRPLTIQWEKDGSRISNSAKHTSKAYSLIVTNMETTDVGNYTVYVSGDNVDLSKTVRLSALMRPELTTPMARERTITTFHVANITCSVEGNPPPVITWYKNTQRIDVDGDRFQLESASGRHTLMIRSFNASDNGVYQCSASNAVGVAFQTTYLTAKDDIPGPPRHVKVYRFGNGMVEVQWKMPLVTNGPIMSYTIYYWQLPDGVEKSRVHNDVDSLRVLLSSLVASAGYSVSVAASTSRGEGARSHVKTVTAPTVAPHATTAEATTIRATSQATGSEVATAISREPSQLPLSSTKSTATLVATSVSVTTKPRTTAVRTAKAATTDVQALISKGTSTESPQLVSTSTNIATQSASSPTTTTTKGRMVATMKVPPKGKSTESTKRIATHMASTLPMKATEAARSKMQATKLQDGTESLHLSSTTTMHTMRRTSLPMKMTERASVKTTTEAATTKAPVPKTEAPASKTEAPASTTETPASKTEAPVSTTEARARRTEPSAAKTEAHIPRSEAHTPRTEDRVSTSRVHATSASSSSSSISTTSVTDDKFATVQFVPEDGDNNSVDLEVDQLVFNSTSTAYVPVDITSDFMLIAYIVAPIVGVSAVVLVMIICCVCRRKEEKLEETVKSKPGWIPQSDSAKGVSLRSYEHVPIAAIPPMHAVLSQRQESVSSKPSVHADTISEVSETKADSDDDRMAPAPVMDAVRVLPPGMVALPHRGDRHRHSGRSQQSGYGSPERPTSVRRSGPPVSSKPKDRYSGVSSRSSPRVAAARPFSSATESTEQAPFGTSNQRGSMSGTQAPYQSQVSSATQPERSSAGHIDVLASTDGRHPSTRTAREGNVQPPKRTMSQQEKETLDSMMDELSSIPSSTLPHGSGHAAPARNASLKRNQRDHAAYLPPPAEVVLRNGHPTAAAAAPPARESVSGDLDDILKQLETDAENLNSLMDLGWV